MAYEQTVCKRANALLACAPPANAWPVYQIHVDSLTIVLNMFFITAIAIIVAVS